VVVRHGCGAGHRGLSAMLPAWWTLHGLAASPVGAGTAHSAEWTFKQSD